MPMILFLNIKGGVAKTTTLVAVAEALACQDRKVLVIDTDHQAAASELLLGSSRLEQAERQKKTLHDLLTRMFADDFQADDVGRFVQQDASNVDRAAGNVGVVPGSLKLEILGDRLLKSRVNLGDFEFKRRRAQGLKAIKAWAAQNGYAFVLVDCPPSVAPQVELFLLACEGYVVPCIPDWLSVRGVRWLQKRLLGLSPRPALGIAWTLYRTQVHSHMETMEQARRNKGVFKQMPKPFESAIPNANAVVEANTASQDGTRFATYGEKYRDFAPSFRALAEEIAERAGA
jgi:chromosome partitioning protein